MIYHKYQTLQLLVKKFKLNSKNKKKEMILQDQLLSNYHLKIIHNLIHPSNSIFKKINYIHHKKLQNKKFKYVNNQPIKKLPSNLKETHHQLEVEKSYLKIINNQEK